MAKDPNEPKKKYYSDFSGGVNNYLGPRQIKNNESPQATNCDFIGLGGVKNRQGYSELGTVGATYDGGIYGMAKFKTASKNQLIKFAQNPDTSKVVLNYSTGGAWTAVTGTVFNSQTDMNVVQAGGYLYSANGVDAMSKYEGTVWAAQTDGSIGRYPEYYDKRIWVVDETNTDTLNFSMQYTSQGDFTDVSAGTVTFMPGSGIEIRGIKNFKDALYIFCFPVGIYRITPAVDPNTFTTELITNAIGCVSYRSIVQVEEDLFFASDDGVYSLGEVANYLEVRTTNKSGKIQQVFDNMTSSNKEKICAVYHEFKYHLFYSLGGANNDSCMVYDIRYKGWHDWRNMAANSAVVWVNASDNFDAYFGHPSSGKVYKMYSGETDDGTAITSTWYSKSFDEKLADTMKLYLSTTFWFGAIESAINLSIMFDDNTNVSVSESISFTRPTGGIGRTAFGRTMMVPDDNATAVGGIGFLKDAVGQDVNYVGQPLRVKAKGKKFAIQYRISGTGDWQLDSISQALQLFGHYKFPSNLKLN